MTDPNFKKLSIIIPVFNKWNFTKACLEDLSQLSDDHEIIIVDNASSDETNEQIMALSNTPHLYYKLSYFRNDENLGFAKACNKGYQIARSDNVLFLNNDIRVKSNHENWTQALIDRCSEGLVGPTMGQLNKDLSFMREENKLLEGNAYMSGWCLASSKEIFNKLIINDYKGPFSEEFGIAYFEDTDLGFRSHLAGIKNIIVEIPVVHFGKQTSKQLNTYQLYTKARNIFVQKWKK